MLLLTIISFAIALVACGNKTTDQGTKEETDIQPAEGTANQEIEINDDEKVNEDKVVAQINDIEVTGEVYNLIYVQMKIQLNQLGYDINDLDQVKEYAINRLINQEMIKQDAERIGITVSDEEVTSEFELFKSENEDQFQTFLDTYHLTEQTFREQLFFEIMHDKYIESELPTIEITDEEVETIYNEIKEENQEIAELEEVEEQLKRELRDRKGQEDLQDKLDELKKQATIDTYI